jgi:hypothetical protein
MPVYARENIPMLYDYFFFWQAFIHLCAALFALPHGMGRR